MSLKRKRQSSKHIWRDCFLCHRLPARREDPVLLQVVCGNAAGRGFLKQSLGRMLGPENRAEALRRLPRGVAEEHFAQFLTEAPQQPQQERAPAPKRSPKGTPTRKRPAAALGLLGAVAEAVLPAAPMRRRFGKQPPVENEAPLPPREEPAAERPRRGKGRLRRCNCGWLGVPVPQEACPGGCGASTPTAAAEEFYYHGPWGTYNIALKEGKAALTPERLEKCLDELEAGEKTQPDLADEFSVPLRTLQRWRKAPGPVEDALAAHVEAVRMVFAGHTRQAVLDQCGVATTFFAAVLREAPLAAQAWKAEAARSFSLQQAPAQVPRALPAGFDALGKWMQVPSWSFCPHCGLRSTEAPVAPCWRRHGKAAVEKICKGGCDRNPDELETEGDGEQARPRTRKLLAYVTPQASYWGPLKACLADAAACPPHAILPQLDWSALALLELKVDYQTKRGGRASVTSKQKQSLVRGVWKARDVEETLVSEGLQRAFAWLMANNETYKGWVLHHKALLAAAAPGDNSWRYIRTAQLLLHSHGLEVAARPWLYPRSSFADTDIASRLGALNLLPAGSKPSLRTSFHRKLRCRCVDYAMDFPLVSYMHDAALAKQLSQVVSVATSKRMAPDEMASGMNNFEAYWLHQTQRLEDMCRQMGAFPNLFFTIAPAEWAFPRHYGMLQGAVEAEELSAHQAALTFHLHNCLSAVLEHTLLKKGTNRKECGIEKVLQYVYRFEFQSRGTLHVHVLAWVEYVEGQNVDLLTGTSGEPGPKSPFVAFLEKTFCCGAVDVQCTRADTSHILLQYVIGYATKASDALHFHRREAQGQGGQTEQSHWAQIYRMLCKRQPLEQEISMEFACLPLVLASFTGDDCYAPVPGSTAINNSRHAYLAFQQCLAKKHKSIFVTPEQEDASEEAEEEEQTEDETIEFANEGDAGAGGPQERPKKSFLEWLRGWKEASRTPLPQDDAVGDAAQVKFKYEVQERNLAGQKTEQPFFPMCIQNKTVIAVRHMHHTKYVKYFEVAHI